LEKYLGNTRRFKKAIKVRDLVTKRIDPNPLGEAIEDLVSMYFADIVRDPELLEKVFVMDSHRSRYLLKFFVYFQRLRDVLKNSPKGIQDLSLKAGSRNAMDVMQKEISEYRKHRKDKVLILLGRIGCGKSTFIRRFFEIELKQRGNANDIVYIYIDLLSSRRGKKVDFENEIETQILRVLRHKYESLNLFSWDTELLIFPELVEQLRSSSGSPKIVNRKQYRRRLTESFDQVKTDKGNYINFIFRYLINDLKLLPCIIIDNVDNLDVTQQKEILSLAFHKAEWTKGVVIVTLRGGTFMSLYDDWLNSYSNIWTKVYHLEPPNFTDVLTKRINYLLEKLEGSTVSFPYENVTFTVNDVKPLMKLVINTVAPSREARYHIVEAVSNHNLREAFDVLIDITTSGHIPIIEFVRAHIDGKQARIPYHCIINAIMLSNFCYYLESRSHIKNIFDYDPVTGINPNILLPYRVLSYMHALTRESGRMRRMSEILEDFSVIGYSGNHVDIALRRLFDKKLIFTWQYNANPSSIKPDHDCFISDRGIFYYEHLIYCFQYIQKVIEDTYLPEYLEISLVQEPDDLVIKIEHVKRFYKYLKEVEEEELGRLKDIKDYRVSSDRITKKIANQLLLDLRAIAVRHSLNLDLRWLRLKRGSR
jgi:hypothetical protein